MKNILAATAALAFLGTAPAWAQSPAVPPGFNQFGTYQNSVHLYSPNGQFRGDLNSNPFDPDSVSNQFGPYGNPFSPDSVNNPFGAGNPYGDPGDTP